MPDPARQLDAWLATAEHLRAAGLPVAVTGEFIAAWLRRHGVAVDWVVAA